MPNKHFVFDTSVSQKTNAFFFSTRVITDTGSVINDKLELAINRSQSDKLKEKLYSTENWSWR